MKSDIYSDGTYRSIHPSWHAPDAAWKADQIVALMTRHGIKPRTVCDVGCGSGDIVIRLRDSLAPDVSYFGYEPSSDAFEICSAKAGPRVQFMNDDVLAHESAHFDVALAIDVMEHVNDYSTFLEGFRRVAQWKILHVPLDLSAPNVMRRRALPRKAMELGHLHFFTADLALEAMRNAGYAIRACAYTPSHETLTAREGWTGALRVPRRALARVDADLAARLLGGFSLLVLAQ